ncbi:MAG: hypothetical protein Q9193_001078 [Seirophora villosa]
MATNVDAKLLKQTKFPPEFSQKVDMKKVNVEVMKKWIAGKISDILGNEDDVVIELCFNLLEGSRFPDIKVLQIQLTGFLDKDTPKFCKELWTLCLSAQSNAQGVPKELLEAKKLELIQEKVLQSTHSVDGIDAEKAAEEAQRRKEQERTRERNIDSIRQRERADRGRGRDLLRGAGSHLIGMTTVGLHVVILSIHTSLANETVNDTKAAVGHPRPDDRTVDLSPVRGRLLDGIDMTRKEPDGAAIVQAGHQHRYAKAVEEIEDMQFPTVVLIELEPTHVQTRLAHDPPEDPERGELPLCPPVPRLRQHYETASTGTDQCHRHQPLDLVLVLVHQELIEEAKGDLEDLHPIKMMTWMIHALMLAKDETIMIIGVEAVAVAAAAVDTLSSGLAREAQAEALVPQGPKIGRGTGPLNVMLLLQEDGVTPLQVLRLSGSNQRRLILLWRK